MAKYRVLTPVKTADGKIHQPDEIVELTDQEAKNCMSFKAIVPVPVAAQPAQQVVAPFSQQASVAQAPSVPVPNEETVSTEETVTPPESDVR